MKTFSQYCAVIEGALDTVAVGQQQQQSQQTQQPQQQQVDPKVLNQQLAQWLQKSGVPQQVVANVAKALTDGMQKVQPQVQQIKPQVQQVQQQNPQQKTQQASVQPQPQQPPQPAR